MKKKSTLSKKTPIKPGRSVVLAVENVDDNKFKPKHAKDVLFRKNVDGTVAIMKLDRDDYFFTLDGIASEIWLQFDGKKSLSNIKASIIEEFSPPVSRFEKDLEKLLSQLKKEGLI